MTDPPTEQQPPTSPPPGPVPPAQQPPPVPDEHRSVGELIFDVSERVTILVREEIELAKAEVIEKLTTLGRGAGIGAAAAVFLLAALLMILFAIAFAINDLLGVESAVWAGFLIEALVWIIVAAIAAMVAKKLFGEVESPTPDMAIEELKETKETLGKTP